MYERNMRIDCESWWVEVKGLTGDEDGLFLFIEYFLSIQFTCYHTPNKRH